MALDGEKLLSALEIVETNFDSGKLSLFETELPPKSIKPHEKNRITH